MWNRNADKLLPDNLALISSVSPEYDAIGKNGKMTHIQIILFW